MIRIWLEETAEEAGRDFWRGHITHVPSEKRVYLKDLNTILMFIAPYLKAIRSSASELSEEVPGKPECNDEAFPKRD